MTTQHEPADLARALGAELRSARKASGVPLARLAAGMDPATVLARESGQGDLTVVELVALCGRLGTSPAVLLEQALTHSVVELAKDDHPHDG